MPKPGQQRRHPKDVAYLTALVANRHGEIYELDGYAAVGMAGRQLTPLTVDMSIPTPHGAEAMFLPDRRPVVYHLRDRRLETLDRDPYRPGEPVFPVALFNSPGYVNTHLAAYAERSRAPRLPLFSYGAAGWHADGFRSTLIRVDAEPRQDLRLMKPGDVQRGIQRLRRELPDNRLRAHLEKCALTYGCPAGKNFFLGRYEAPLPTAERCNARCLGCLSLQAEGGIRSSQERIDFTPTPEEIAQVALSHIGRVPDGVVSFGQGCEGDPLLAARVIEPAVRRIREHTNRGTVNLNCNGSLPDTVKALFKAGMDSMRVSLNSVREPCYRAYFRPRGYAFADVARSIDSAVEQGGWVSLNYLNMPGITDTPEEMDALMRFLKKHPVHMIQWRNLNYDPLRYLDTMERAAPQGGSMGIPRMLETLGKRFPDLMFGYFNPPKSAFRRRALPSQDLGDGNGQ